MISPEAQSKLDRIEDLLADRGRIETELELILGISGGNVGRKLVAARTSKEVHRENGKKGGAGKHKKERICGNCRRPGHRSDNCPGIGNEEVVSDLDSGPLSESQYDDVKIAQDSGSDTREIAEEMGVEIREVNKAYQARDYKGYLILRKES